MISRTPDIRIEAEHTLQPIYLVDFPQTSSLSGTSYSIYTDKLFSLKYGKHGGIDCLPLVIRYKERAFMEVFIAGETLSEFRQLCPEGFSRVNLQKIETEIVHFLLQISFLIFQKYPHLFPLFLDSAFSLGFFEGGSSKIYEIKKTLGLV